MRYRYWPIAATAFGVALLLVAVVLPRIGKGGSGAASPQAATSTVAGTGEDATASSATPSASASASLSASPSGPAAGCSGWSASAAYAAGDVITYRSRTYTAALQHTLGGSVSWSPDTTPQLWRAGGTCTAPVPTRKPKFAPPPATWKEHWFEHSQNLKLIAYNDTVAVYFDSSVQPAAAKWMLPYLTRMWQYAQRTYGGASNRMNSGRLYSIHHEGRYFGGHPSTVYDASHDFRNVSDVGGNDWVTPQYEVVTHETGHIVEGIAAGKHGSPAFPLWKDSKWMEFYIYDVYVALGMTAEAKDFAKRMNADSHTDGFPAAGSHWFRDWFYPLWRDHGHAQVMVNFFRLLGRYFPANGQNFARDLNWGEYIHFMSGAAGTDLKPLAVKAFGWPAAWETQYQQARTAFPKITY